MKRLGSLVQEGSGLQSQPSDASAGVPPAAKARRRSRSSGASASTRCDSLPSEGSGLASSLPRASSGSRKRVVRRVVKVRKVKKRTGASSSNGGGGGGCPPAGGISIGDMVVIGDVLRSIDAYDSKLQKAAGVAELDTSNSGVLDLNAIPSLSPEEQDALVTVFDHMLAGFDAPRYRSRYGHCSDDDDEPMLHFGQDVPSYFANVVDQSIHRRKVLSMAGMRNLVAEGRRIYEDLAARKFASDPELYCGDVGVNRMRRVTGNTVDLDTCVLRASDRCTMRAINAANEKQGLPTWDCYTEFSMSDQAYQIANAATLALTEQFVKDMKMTDEEARRRKVHASQIEMPVPMATHNTQRGKWPVWHYTNCGVDSFHANVPNMHDVNGALLRAPMHCVKGYLHVHQLAAAHGSEEARAEALQKYLDRFFEDAVADSCFNMKWKAVEEFNEQLAHERTIVHLLQVTQADHQALFSAIMDDDDDDLTRERAEMWRLVEGAEAYSTRDAKALLCTPSVVSRVCGACVLPDDALMQEPGSYVDIVDRCVTGRIMIDSIINAFVPPQPPLTPSTAADSPGSPGATTTTAASPRCCAAPTTPARPPAAPTPALQPMPHQHPSGRRKRTHAFVPLLSPHGALVSPAPLHAPPPTPPPPPQSHAKRYRESRDMSPVNRRHALPPQPHDAAPRRQSPDPCRATPFWGEGARGGSVRVSSRSSSVQSLQGGAGLCDTWVGDECVASQRGCAGVVDEGCCPRSPSGAVVLEAASDFTCGVVHHSSLRRRDEVFSMPLPAVPAAVDGHVRAVQPAHVGRPGHPQPVIMHSPITPAAARQVAVSPVSTQVPRRGLRSPPLRCDEGGAGGVRVGGGIAPLDVSSILVGRQLEWDARDLNSSRISALLEDPLTSLSSARASDPQAVHWGERRASPAAVPAPLPLPKAPGSGRYSIPRLPRSDAPAAEPQPLPPGVLLEAEVHPPVPLLPAAGQHLPDLHAWGAPPLRLPESSCDGSMRAAALLAAAAGQHHTPLHHRAAPLPRNVSPPRALRAPSPLALVAGPGTGPEAAAAAAVLGDAVLLDIAHDTPAPPPKSLELLLYENLSSTAAAEAKRRLRGAQARLLSAMQARLAKALLQRRFAQWRAWRDTALAADYFDEPVLALSGISITPSHTLQALHDSTDACTQTPHAAASPALSATASSVSTAKSQSKSPRMRLRQMLAEESVGYVMGVTACTFVSYIYERLGAYQSGTQWFFLPSQLSGGVLTNDIHLPIPPFHPERSVVQGGEQLPSPRTEPLDEGDSQRSSLDETLDAPATPETPKTDESGDLPLRPVVSTASITDTPLESPCLSASQPGGVVLMGHSGPLSDPAQPESTSTAGGLGGEMRKEQKKLATRSPRHQKVLSPKMRPPEHVLERADAVQPPVQSQTLRQQSSGMLSVKPLSNSLSALSTGEHDPAALLKMEGHKPDQSMVESLERSCLSIAGAVATSQAVKKLVESIGAKGNDSSTNKLDQSNGAFSVLDLNGSTESDGVRKAQQQEQDRASALSGDGGSGHLTPPTRSPTTGPVNLSPKSGPCRHLPARQRRTSKLLGDPGHPKDEYLERFSPRAANVSGGGQSTSSSMKSNPSHHADASPHASHDSREGFELQQHPITARLARDSGRSEMTLHPGESSSSSRGGTDHMLPPPARQPRRTRAPPPDGGGHRVADVEYAVGDSLELDPTDRGGVPRHPKERAVVCVTSPNDLKRAAVAGGTQRVRMREVVLTQRVSQPPALASPPRRRGWSGGPVGGAAAAQGAAAAAAAAGGGADRSGGADGGSTAVLSHSPAGVVARTLALAHTSPPRPVDALRDTSPRRHRSASPPGMAGCVGGLSPLSDVEDYAVCSAVGSRGASPVRSVRSVRSLRSVREVEEVHVSVSSSMVSELNRLRAENESLRRQQHQRVSPVRRAVDLEPPQAVVHEQFDHDPRASPHRHRPTVLIPVTNPRDFRSEVLPSSRTRNIEDIPMRVPLQGRR